MHLLLFLVLAPIALHAGSKSPDLVPFQPDLLKQLKVASGCRVSAWASGLDDARMMEVAPDGTVYLTRPGSNDVLALKDADGDGAAESRRTVISGFSSIHGIELAGDRLLTATPTSVYESKVAPDGSVSSPKVIADGLPGGNSHALRTMAFGPDKRLYLSVGSSCNVCEETNPEFATMLVMAADGSQRRVFARGLRNTIGFGWHPDTGEMWGMDHGSDMIGDDRPPEELNLLKEGADYGWPWAWADQQPHPTMGQPRSGPRKAQRVAASVPMALGFPAHSAPIAFVFYPGGSLPVPRGDAFVAFHGSWNRTHPQGYKVCRVKFSNGKPVGYEDFLSGFLLDDDRQFGRPAGLAILKDGSLLVSDDTGGVIYRVSRE